MSALNVVLQRDRVVLVTDGAAWDQHTGIVQGFPNKQMPPMAATNKYLARDNKSRRVGLSD
jgi:hypothetical protein